MAPRLFDDLTHSLTTVLDLRARQQSLSASNIANADTPGYKARHLDFEAALSDAFDGGSLGLQRTEAGHIAGVGGADAPEVVEVEPAPWSEDGNSVYAEREIQTMNANTLMYRAVGKGLSKKLALLKFAASDGR